MRRLFWMPLLSACIGAGLVPHNLRERVPESTEGTVITDTGWSTVTTPTEPAPTVGDSIACYLGDARDFTVCLDAYEVLSLPAEYDYPPPLSGSLQYVAPSRYLDLDQLDPSIRLAPNFLLDEVAQASKGRYAVVQGHAVARLQAMRDVLGALVINSGYRNPVYNDGVGGANWSRHMYGDAFDIDPVSATLEELADECEEEGAGWVGVYETHVHCDWRDDPMEPAFFVGARSAVAETMQPQLAAELILEADGTLWAPASGWDEGEPLREWIAYDDAGHVVGQAVSRGWRPPAEAATVEVVVGRAITVSLTMP